MVIGLEWRIREVLGPANRGAIPLPCVAGIDVSGTTAMICLVPVSQPLWPRWLLLKAGTPGLLAGREIGAQAAIAGSRGVFDGCSVAWIEEPFSGSMHSVRALNRTIGALAAGLPRSMALSEISASSWRSLLGIKGGPGSKERAQQWAVSELHSSGRQAWERVSRDHNAADAYGIARAILTASEDHHRRGTE